MPTTEAPDDKAALQRRHLLLGWWSLLLFVLLGIGLETMHAFKVDWFLDPACETRRLLWRLAHAHGTGLALLHLGFAFTVGRIAATPRLASPCLSGASIAIPLGFFLGGVDARGGDPGVGIALLPLGALLLVVAVATTARAAQR